MSNEQEPKPATKADVENAIKDDRTAGHSDWRHCRCAMGSHHLDDGALATLNRRFHAVFQIQTANSALVNRTKTVIIIS